MTRPSSELAGEAGLEPATCGFGDRCSNQLSYSPALSHILPDGFLNLFHFFMDGMFPAERTELFELHLLRLVLFIARVGVVPAFAHRAGH
jgi:hypothetical protein